MKYGHVEATIPAEDGWFAEFGTSEAKGSHPVIAWVAVDTGSEGKKATLWYGLCLWADGPDYAEAMGDFVRYFRADWTED